MSLFKKYAIVRSNTREVLEEFSTLEAAEQFMIMMQQKGEDVMIKTDDEDADETTPDNFEIEGLDIETPSVEFGSDLDVFNEGFGDLEVEDDAPDIDLD